MSLQAIQPMFAGNDLKEKHLEKRSLSFKIQQHQIQKHEVPTFLTKHRSSNIQSPRRADKPIEVIEEDSSSLIKPQATFGQPHSFSQGLKLPLNLSNSNKNSDKEEGIKDQNELLDVSGGEPFCMAESFVDLTANQPPQLLVQRSSLDVRRAASVSLKFLVSLSI